MPDPITKPSIWQWSNRWAPHITTPDDADATDPVATVSPYYFAHEVLGVLFTLTTSAVAVARYPEVRLKLADTDYARMQVRQAVSASSTRLYAFQRGGNQFSVGAMNDRLQEMLPENFLWLPHATLTIEVHAALAGDTLSDIAIISRRWRVA